MGQDDGSETDRTLDGQPVPSINSNLTSGVDLSRAQRLPENCGIAFMGDTKGGPFDIDGETARQLRSHPNPDGRPNANVVRRWINGADITGRRRDRWIIDFGIDMPEPEAALYEGPFELATRLVKPIKSANRREARARRWWIHAEPATNMRIALRSLRRYIATPITAKYRLFVWVDGDVLPDHQLIVFASDDDFTFGVLHSRVHEVWALAQGTQLETRPRYTPTTTFETFPLPDATAEQRARVGEAARRLVELRDGWLNPPDFAPIDLEKRTLTNLYNQRPTWLANAHAALNASVSAAYGWSLDLSDAEVLSRLLTLNRVQLGTDGEIPAGPT